MDDLFKIKVEYAEKLIIYFLKEYKTKKIYLISRLCYESYKI